MYLDDTIFQVRNTYILTVVYLLLIGFNLIMGAVAASMAKSRGLKPVPAFFAAFFGSFVALFYIAMHPKKTVEYEEGP